MVQTAEYYREYRAARRESLKDPLAVFPCVGCNQVKPGSQMVSGKAELCKECHARRHNTRKIFSPEYKSVQVKANDRWRVDNPRASKNNVLKFKYKMSLEDFENLLDTQKGDCAICSLPAGDGESFVVDHDHNCCPRTATCGKCVRALVHGYCNRVEGMATDDLIWQILSYREKHRKG